MIIVTESVVAA